MLKTLQETARGKYTKINMDNPFFTVSSQSSPHTQQKYREGGNKIVVGTVVKAMICELEEEEREGFSRGIRKDLTGVV